MLFSISSLVVIGRMVILNAVVMETWASIWGPAHDMVWTLQTTGVWDQSVSQERRCIGGKTGRWLRLRNSSSHGTSAAHLHHERVSKHPWDKIYREIPASAHSCINCIFAQPLEKGEEISPKTQFLPTQITSWGWLAVPQIFVSGSCLQQWCKGEKQTGDAAGCQL